MFCWLGVITTFLIVLFSVFIFQTNFFGGIDESLLSRAEALAVVDISKHGMGPASCATPGPGMMSGATSMSSMSTGPGALHHHGLTTIKHDLSSLYHHHHHGAMTGSVTGSHSPTSSLQPTSIQGTQLSSRQPVGPSMHHHAAGLGGDPMVDHLLDPICSVSSDMLGPPCATSGPPPPVGGGYNHMAPPPSAMHSVTAGMIHHHHHHLQGASAGGGGGGGGGPGPGPLPPPGVVGPTSAAAAAAAAHHHHHHHHHAAAAAAAAAAAHMQLHDVDTDPRELENFAERFKQRRIKLGVTQADVGKALANLKLPGVGSLSQSTICRFESLTLSHNNMIALKPVLQTWLEEAEAQFAGENKKKDPNALNVLPNGEKKRKRTSIAAQEKRSLEAYFAVQPRPSGDKIANIAGRLDLKKNVVRVWFCNQRQKQKRMKFSAVQH